MERPRSGVVVWAGTWFALVTAQLAAAGLGDRPLGSAGLLFAVVVVAAAGCVVSSGYAVARAMRDDCAELGLIGAYSMGVSVLPLVHGLTVPGVLYGDNEATMSSVMWALPLASVAAAPLMAPGLVGGAVRRWRQWVAGTVTLQFVIAAWLLLQPSLLPTGDMGAMPAAVLALACLVPSLVLSWRHHRLYGISRRPAVIVVSLSFALIASANLIWVNGTPMSAGFWLAHGLDIVGVLAGSIVAALSYRRNTVERTILRPLTLRDPLDALEFGLDPVVRAFVADLGDKDEITREHVKRTAEAAIAVGTRLRLSPGELRTVGLGALLHDVGKLHIDDAVLKKPGKLTDAEFDQVKRHTELGERLVLGSPVLASIAPIVRHHHERIDGRGYPDRLAGDEIPLLARIVSVCDAYDAMSHTRQYRTGMAVTTVRSTLTEHAGTQWDERVVEHFLAALDDGAIADEPTRLADVGLLPRSCECVAELVSSPVPA